MVVEMIADIGVIDHNRHAHVLQQARWPDARQLQKLWRVDGPARQDHLGPLKLQGFPTALVFHPHGFGAFEQHAGHHGFGDHLQVLALHRGPQKGARRRIAPPAFDRHLIVASTLLGLPIEIGGIGQTRFAGRSDVIFHQPVQTTAVFRNEQRPPRAAIIVGAGLIILHRAKGGQNLVPAPTGGRLPPFVIIGTVAANIDHRVDG